MMEKEDHWLDGIDRNKLFKGVNKFREF